jgi:hypothetical protein
MAVHQLIWGWPADFVDVSHLWPLSVTAAVPTDAVAPDPEDLRDDLEYDIIVLRQELKAQGYDLADFPDVIKETRALHLPLDAQIQKLQKCAERIRILLMRTAPSSTTPSALLSALAPPLIGQAPSSNSPSTLLSASAPSAGALSTCGKQVNKRRREENESGSFQGNRVSYEDPRKREDNAKGADEKTMQGEVSWVKEFLLKLSLVLRLSRNMDPTIVTHTCKKVLTKKLQGLQNSYLMR